MKYVYVFKIFIVSKLRLGNLIYINYIPQDRKKRDNLTCHLILYLLTVDLKYSKKPCHG